MTDFCAMRPTGRRNHAPLSDGWHAARGPDRGGTDPVLRSIGCEAVVRLWSGVGFNDGR
jgi:pyruvate-formate lyase